MKKAIGILLLLAINAMSVVSVGGGIHGASTINFQPPDSFFIVDGVSKDKGIKNFVVYSRNTGWFTDSTQVNYPNNPIWRGTVTPRREGYVFTPKSITYDWITTSKRGDFIAKDTMKPVISITPLKDCFLKDSIELFSKVYDNSYRVLKIRYYLSTDSGKTFSLIDTLIPFRVEASPRWNYKDSLLDVKKKTIFPKIASKGYQIKVEMVDPDTNTGVTYSNIFSVALEPVTAVLNSSNKPLSDNSITVVNKSILLNVGTGNYTLTITNIAGQLLYNFEGTSNIKMHNVPFKNHGTFLIKLIQNGQTKTKLFKNL